MGGLDAWHGDFLTRGLFASTPPRLYHMRAWGVFVGSLMSCLDVPGIFRWGLRGQGGLMSVGQGETGVSSRLVHIPFPAIISVE